MLLGTRIRIEMNVALGEDFFAFNTWIMEGICAGRETKTKQKGENMSTVSNMYLIDS